MSDLVGVRRDGDVCILTLQRVEKLNAISTDVERALLRALEHDDLRASAAIVITGGERVFSAGADVTEFRGRAAADVLAYYRDTGRVYELVAELQQPTFSAIAGYCLGGGLELALATDFRIADETAVFGFPELSLGLLPSSGGTYRLTRLLGPARAKELTLLGGRIDAADALARGLVTELVPTGHALERALALAHSVAALPRVAAAVTKQTIDSIPGSSRDAALSLERVAYALLAQTDDADERAAEFVRRRSADT